MTLSYEPGCRGVGVGGLRGQMSLWKHKGPRPQLENVMTKTERERESGYSWGYGYGNRGIAVRFQADTRFCNFSKSVRTGVGLTQSPILCVLIGGLFLPESKRPGHEADHSLHLVLILSAATRLLPLYAFTSCIVTSPLPLHNEDLQDIAKPINGLLWFDGQNTQSASEIRGMQNFRRQFWRGH